MTKSVDHTHYAPCYGRFTVIMIHDYLQDQVSTTRIMPHAMLVYPVNSNIEEEKEDHLSSAAVFSFVLSSTVERCRYGWFGLNCQYQCHCAGSAPCDKHDGSCSSGCHQDWFGPACQYSSVRGTALSGEGWLLDNDDTTCNTRMSRSVKVTLDTPIPLTWVRVVLRDAGHLKQLQMSYLKSRIDSSSLHTSCSEISTAKVDARTLDIYCPTSDVVLAVTLEGAAVQGLCSLYISAGRNVALKQTTKQSSGYDPQPDFWHSEFAVDGMIDIPDTTDQQKTTCTHTSSGSPGWWTLAFSQAVHVTKFLIYNRRAGCLYRSCDSGYIKSDYSGTCIKLYNDKLSWKDARSVCKTAGGDLVKIMDKTMNQFITSLASTQNYWIGLHDREQEGRFRWLDENKEAKYTAWVKSEPNGKDRENCVEINHPVLPDGTWNDLSCSDKNKFICEKKFSTDQSFLYIDQHRSAQARYSVVPPSRLGFPVHEVRVDVGLRRDILSLCEVEVFGGTAKPERPGQSYAWVITCGLLGVALSLTVVAVGALVCRVRKLSSKSKMLSGHEVDYPREITEREAAGNGGQCQHYHRPQNAPDYVRLYDNHSVYHNGVSRNLARESQADLIPPDSPMTADSSQQDFSEAKGASGAASLTKKPSPLHEVKDFGTYLQQSSVFPTS
ncbi:hypothetical protein RRG08_011997 [Elysia crispata]|uniref:C-type lectin domain-containing protein n=1 Tax=Elysia crispata TaxID=231223 RepID=A0AAE1ASJ3_9GAST|nr:hypothetical protein RRG08_011997 [Elysia crispata]